MKYFQIAALLSFFVSSVLPSISAQRWSLSAYGGVSVSNIMRGEAKENRLKYNYEILPIVRESYGLRADYRIGTSFAVFLKVGKLTTGFENRDVQGFGVLEGKRIPIHYFTKTLYDYINIDVGLKYKIWDKLEVYGSIKNLIFPEEYALFRRKVYRLHHNDWGWYELYEFRDYEFTKYDIALEAGFQWNIWKGLFMEAAYFKGSKKDPFFKSGGNAYNRAYMFSMGYTHTFGKAQDKN
ncbi:MAG: hypothetical protein GY705_17510 [Bacteroidetes bacterium]|nr:hypothetical protein [Bacteroidota bacterium]